MLEITLQRHEIARDHAAHHIRQHRQRRRVAEHDLLAVRGTGAHPFHAVRQQPPGLLARGFDALFQRLAAWSASCRATSPARQATATRATPGKRTACLGDDCNRRCNCATVSASAAPAAQTHAKPRPSPMLRSKALIMRRPPRQRPVGVEVEPVQRIPPRILFEERGVAVDHRLQRRTAARGAARPGRTRRTRCDSGCRLRTVRSTSAPARRCARPAHAVRPAAPRAARGNARAGRPRHRRPGQPAAR